MDKVNLNAKLRTEFSKSGRNELRKSGRVPGIYYSKHSEPIAIDVPENMINPLVFTSQTNLINLVLDNGNEFDCILKEIQFDPVTDKVVHFDLIGLTKDESIELEIPVQLTGSAIGVKEGGLLQHVQHKLQIECLPSNIPQHIELNISDLHLGDSLHVSDVKLENITILNPADTVIVTVAHPKVEKEVAEVEAEPTEPEVISKGKTEKEEE
jgi:large subunit ribosomal protein L25